MLGVGTVEAQASAAVGRLSSDEEATGLFAQQALVLEGTAINQHLVDAAQLLGRSKESGMTSHTTHTGCSFIMHKAAEVAPTQEVAKGSRHNFRLRILLQREEEGALQSHGLVKLTLHVGIEWHTGQFLYHLLQQDEAQVTIHIAGHTQVTMDDLLHHLLAKALVEPEAVGHLQGMGGRGGIRGDSLLEAEVATPVAVFTHPGVVPLIDPALHVGTMY